MKSMKTPKSFNNGYQRLYTQVAHWHEEGKNIGKTFSSNFSTSNLWPNDLDRYLHKIFGFDLPPQPSSYDSNFIYMNLEPFFGPYGYEVFRAHLARNDHLSKPEET